MELFLLVLVVTFQYSHFLGAGSNFRDPLRAFEWQGTWFVGVGCNNESMSADLCLFQVRAAYLHRAFHPPTTQTHQLGEVSAGPYGHDLLWPVDAIVTTTQTYTYAYTQTYTHREKQKHTYQQIP